MEWPLLADLPAEDVRQLLSIARRSTFAKGEVVFHRDDPADLLHVIVGGRFAARVTTPQGDSLLSALENGETRSVYRDDFARLHQRHAGA